MYSSDSEAKMMKVGVADRHLFVVFLIGITHLEVVSTQSIIQPEAEFMIRSGVASYTSAENLIDNPTKVEMNLTSWKVEGRRIIRSETDLHSIIPVPIDHVLAVLLDYAGAENMFPRVRESILLERSPNPFDRQTVQIDLGIKVLGFGDVYSYVVNNWVDEEFGAYTQKFNMERSIDDKLYQVLGNYYIEPVVVDGIDCTYIRHYAIVGIQRGSRAMEFAMKTFGMASLRQTLKRVSIAAKNGYSSVNTPPS